MGIFLIILFDFPNISIRLNFVVIAYLGTIVLYLRPFSFTLQGS